MKHIWLVYIIYEYEQLNKSNMWWVVFTLNTGNISISFSTPITSTFKLPVSKSSHQSGSTSIMKTIGKWCLNINELTILSKQTGKRYTWAHYGKYRVYKHWWYMMNIHMLCNFNRLPEKEKRLTGISFSLSNVKFQIFFLDKDIFFTCDGLWTGIPPIDWTTSL